MEAQETYLQLIFGNIAVPFYMAAFTFCLFGMLFVMMVDLRMALLKNKKQKKSVNFSLKYWFTDNGLRLFTNLIMSPMAVFLSFRFGGHFGFELNMLFGFVCGSSIDALIIFLRRKTKFSVFQSKEKKGVD